MRNGLLRTGGVVLVGVVALAALGGQASQTTGRVLAAPEGHGSAEGIFAFSSSLDKDRQLLYVIDAGSQRICVYQVDHSGKDTELTLEAVRTYAADLQLTEFNTKPSVAKIEGMIGQTLKHP